MRFASLTVSYGYFLHFKEIVLSLRSAKFAVPVGFPVSY